MDGIPQFFVEALIVVAANHGYRFVTNRFLFRGG